MLHVQGGVYKWGGVKMGKIKVGLYLDEKLWRTFQRFVSVKRGKIYGAISEEVSKAVARYMASEEVHTNAHKNYTFKRRSVETAERIGAKLDELYPDFRKLTLEQIKRAITEVVSSDPRMHRKYVVMLESLGIIRHWKFGTYDLPRRSIQKEARETMEKVLEAERGEWNEI